MHWPGLDARERETAEIRTVVAASRLAAGDPRAATLALAPVLDGSAPVTHLQVWLAQAFLLEATARDALGDPAASGGAVECALDLAEPEGVLLPFLLHRTPGLLERHARERTSHTPAIAEILDLLAGQERPASPAGQLDRLREPITDGETRVLRYLPTNVSAPEIAGELSMSVNTVRTHMRHIYAKLGAHRRHEVVHRARTLGLLTTYARRPQRDSTQV